MMVTFRLREKRDRDLIEELERIETGMVSHTVRDALRAWFAKSVIFRDGDA